MDCARDEGNRQGETCQVDLMPLATARSLVCQSVPGLQDSMDSCPVDCISWVHKTQLPALEYVSYYRTKRNNVANIMSGMGSNTDVFAAASQFLKARERRSEADDFC